MALWQLSFHIEIVLGSILLLLYSHGAIVGSQMIELRCPRHLVLCTLSFLLKLLTRLLNCPERALLAVSGVHQLMHMGIELLQTSVLCRGIVRFIHP